MKHLILEGALPYATDSKSKRRSDAGARRRLRHRNVRQQTFHRHGRSCSHGGSMLESFSQPLGAKPVHTVSRKLARWTTCARHPRQGTSGHRRSHQAVMTLPAPACVLQQRQGLSSRIARWAHGVVVSHPLSMREALGSIPSVSRMTTASCASHMPEHVAWHGKT